MEFLLPDLVVWKKRKEKRKEKKKQMPLRLAVIVEQNLV